MPINTDLTVEPYFFDYDENKNYHMVLTQPGVALQNRELGEIQLILQNQIERFGSHIFKDGSVVNGCSSRTIPNLEFVRVADEFIININRDINDIDSTFLLVGETSGIRATSLITKEGRVSIYPDTNRFYIKYLNTGINDQKTFLSGETIKIYSSDQNKLGSLNESNLIDKISVLTNSPTIASVGAGYGLAIGDGLVFQKGFFQKVHSQLGIVKDFDQDTTNMVVGFETVEEIITEESDPSLYDNALGYSNYNAPGAHRLKLSPTLIAKNKNDVKNNDKFFTVFEFSNVDGSLVQVNNDPVYNQLGDVIAKGRYEGDGDYVIKPFVVETTPSSNSSLKFNYRVDPGIAYVHGRRVEYLSSEAIETDRAIKTRELNSQIITVNFGNYVIVNELCGSMDSLETITLYDSPQDAISNRRFLTTPLGNAIGTAQIKYVLHESGSKGSPNTTYLAYITNIQMYSGKSFANDVKSLYSNNASGISTADIVLDSNSKAVIYESDNNKLVFPFGKNAIKTLRSANGTINRTQFVTRMSANATLQANGLISVTMGAPHGGGNDILDYSVGTLSSLLEEDFNIITTTNVQTANISGTISVTSSSANVTGTGTSFLSTFGQNEFIALKSGGTTDYRRVVSISNNTFMTVDSAPSFSNTTAVYSKFYPAGYIIPLDSTVPGTRNINVTSATTFEINTGLAAAGTLSTAQNTIVQYKASRTNATQKKKDILRNVFVKVDANTVSSGKINLGLTDVFKIKNVYGGTGYSNTNQDITSWFTLDNGYRDEFYDHSKLIVNPKYQSQLGNKQLLVKVDKFVSNTSAGIGFFSVDSYPIDDSNTANTNAIRTYEIPTYVSSNGSIVDMRDSVDFRLFKSETAASSTTESGATINPSSVASLISSGYLPEPDSNFQTDIEYYLGRIDLLTINTSGQLSVIQGDESETPRTPKPDNDSMVIATAYVPPYPSITARENSFIGKKNYAIRTTVTTNRNYTKKDINTLDKRVERLEYYVTLNQLEQKAKDLQIPDSNGLNRFKNGIFVDPMNSHAFGDTTNFEYKIAIDSSKGVARPTFKTNNIDISFNSNASSGVIKTGNKISLPYTEEVIAKQPFASKYRNCTEDYWTWNGSIELYPQFDMNRDEVLLPNVDASIDVTQPFMDFVNAASSSGSTIFGTRYGDWRMDSWDQSATDTAITTNLNYSRTVSNTFIVPISQTVDLGKSVSDVSVQPFIKSKEVAFIARNLKPKTRIYAYFDDEPVSQYCAPGEKSSITSGKESSIVNRTAPYGTAMYTDAYGNLIGKFLIPEGTFRIGDRTLLLTEVDSLVTGASAALTKAKATYTASNITISSKSTTLKTSLPSIQTLSGRETRTDTFIQPISPPIPWQPGNGDPIAQTYTIKGPMVESGIFLTSIKLYFKSKDPTLGVTVQLVPCIAGQPNKKEVIAACHLNSDQINISDYGDVATIFNFEPVYHDSFNEYAFIVMPDANSPEYRIWMAEVGGTDVSTGSQIYSSPYSGSALKSSNSRTWIALSKEQVKFEINVANFSTTPGIAYFENDNDEFITYDSLTLSNSSISIQSGDEVYASYANGSISNTSINAIVQNLDTVNSILRLDSSTGGFTGNSYISVYRFPQHANTAQANSSTRIGTLRINSIDNIKVHALVPKFSTITPVSTGVSFEYKGTSNTGIKETSWSSVVLDNEKEFVDFERIVVSKSNENSYSLNNSIEYKGILTTSNKYLSPIIDLTLRSTIVVENIINDDITNEETKFGNAKAKYISKPVILDEGQDAEDLLIKVTAYRPIGSDIKVYGKFKNVEDYSKLEDKVWSIFENQSPEIYSSSINNSDFKEYVFKLPTTTAVTGAAWRNASNYNIAQYQGSNGEVYIGFKEFSIKIVLTTSSPNNVPIVNDLQSIALQV